MRVWVLMALVLASVVGAAWGHDAGATGTALCAQTFGEVPVGAGSPIELPVPLLAGVAYVDVPFHSCSSGAYTLDAQSDNVTSTRFCSEEIVRVWAVAGAAGEDFVINWQEPGKNDC